MRHRLILILLALLCSLPIAAHATAGADTYDGRAMIVYVPAKLPASGTRALVVVLHGGMGNAQHIESGSAEKGLGMDAVAEKNGFVVAYLNGTQATRHMGANMLAWNAGGGCCGQPAVNNVDDVGYIKGAVAYLAGKYGINPDRIYGIGHSNGAMMTMRVICETGLYAAAVSVSGPLNLDVATCPAAKGKRILAIHGADDENVPIAGGRGTKGISGAAFNSEEHSRRVFVNSGAAYDLDIVKGADHKLDNIDDALQQNEGMSIAEKAARYFGLQQ